MINAAAKMTGLPVNLEGRKILHVGVAVVEVLFARVSLRQLVLLVPTPMAIPVRLRVAHLQGSAISKAGVAWMGQFVRTPRRDVAEVRVVAAAGVYLHPAPEIRHR